MDCKMQSLSPEPQTQRNRGSGTSTTKHCDAVSAAREALTASLRRGVWGLGFRVELGDLAKVIV